MELSLAIENAREKSPLFSEAKSCLSNLTSSQVSDILELEQEEYRRSLIHTRRLKTYWVAGLAAAELILCALPDFRSMTGVILSFAWLAIFWVTGFWYASDLYMTKSHSRIIRAMCYVHDPRIMPALIRGLIPRLRESRMWEPEIPWRSLYDAIIRESARLDQTSSLDMDKITARYAGTFARGFYQAGFHEEGERAKVITALLKIPGIADDSGNFKTFRRIARLRPKSDGMRDLVNAAQSAIANRKVH